MFVARHCYFFKTYLLILWCIYEPQVEALPPTFLVPIASTAPRDVDENSAKDVSILTVEGQDGDGDVLTFSIFSQNPMSPPFELESNTGLFKTPNGLDAETDQSFTFVFSVSDGTSSVDSVPFTVNINDVNDNAPQFVGTPYEASLLDSVINGTSAVIVNATDADVTPATITYSITGGNTNNAFAIVSNGNITTNANLTGGSSFTLNVEASDGTNSNTTTVTITVNVNYCATNPCQNGGQCNNGATTHTCTCDSGYTGINCTEIVDNCASNPCKNGGTCNNGLNFYNCTCLENYSGTNCENPNRTEGSEPDCMCCICPWLIPVVLVVILIIVGIVLYRMYRKGKLNGAPLIGKCFSKKRQKAYEKELEHHQSPPENGCSSESPMIVKIEKSADTNLDVHKEGSITDKLQEFSKKRDEVNTTNSASNGVDSSKVDEKTPIDNIHREDQIENSTL